MRTTNPTHSGRRVDRGFTLIEAMMATVILAICVTGLTSALVASSNGTAFANKTYQLTAAAQTAMEELSSQSLASLAPQSSPVTSLSVSPTVDADVTVSAKLDMVNRRPGGQGATLGWITVVARHKSGGSITLHRLITSAGSFQ